MKHAMHRNDDHPATKKGMAYVKQVVKQIRKPATRKTSRDK